MPHTDSTRGYYTYAYLRENRTPYYIGKGKGGRAWSNSGRKIAKKPRDLNRILILKQNLTEKEAFRHEIYMIAIFGKKASGDGILWNITDGGEGSSGRSLSEETKRKISKSRKGKVLNREARAKRLESMRGRRGTFFGKSHSEETRRKIAEAHMGKQASEKTRAKLSEVTRGERNPRAKSFIFISPGGKEFLVTGRFKAFCREQGLASAVMARALRRNCCPPPRSGWKVCYAGDVHCDRLRRPQFTQCQYAMSEDLFIAATRKKFRFPSDKGDLSVEQLWDLPLKARSGFDLDTVAISVNATLKGLAEESFVEVSSNPRRKDLEDMLEIVKYVIQAKQAEAKAATDRVAKAALKRKLQDAIEAKEGQALLGSSLEDLKAQLEALG
jgi:hypothetical protein